MAEALTTSELTYKRQMLFEGLRDVGFFLPEEPQLGTHVTGPSPVLVRSESTLSRLTNSNEKMFTPQTGEMGTKGVFFADCLKALMYPSEGAFYVFHTGDVAQDWLVAPSEQFRRELERVAQQRNLRLTSVSGGVEAEEVVYDRFNVYQAKRGIATSSSPVGLDKVSAVLVTPNFIASHELAKIPPVIKNKIIELPRL